MKNMKRVANKIALITGGASGLGEAVARCLIQEGARVMITDCQVSLGQGLAEELHCGFLEQDVADEQRWDVIIHQVEKHYGPVNILVNNAGIEGNAGTNPENATLSDWQRVQRVNVEGSFLGCRAVIPSMRRAGGGSIINISSIASMIPTAHVTAYGASKAAVRHLTKSVAMHCAECGSKIRCNSVHPGVIRTAMVERIIEGMAIDSVHSKEELMTIESETLIPQGEFQTPKDIAYAVLFLASDEARHITGAQLVVDGGITMHG